MKSAKLLTVFVFPFSVMVSIIPFTDPSLKIPPSLELPKWLAILSEFRRAYETIKIDEAESK